MHEAVKQQICYCASAIVKPLHYREYWSLGDPMNHDELWKRQTICGPIVRVVELISGICFPWDSLAFLASWPCSLLGRDLEYGLVDPTEWFMHPWFDGS